MKKLKSLIGPMIILAVIAVGVLVIAFWKEEPEPQEIVKVNAYEGKDEELILENERLRFVMDSSTTRFFLEDKESGQIWRSNPEGIGEDALALNTEKQKLQSTLLLTAQGALTVPAGSDAFQQEKSRRELILPAGRAGDSDWDVAKQWVEWLWNQPLRKGARRYYDNCLYLFALLALSGNYRIYR